MNVNYSKMFVAVTAVLFASVPVRAYEVVNNMTINDSLSKN